MSFWLPNLGSLSTAVHAVTPAQWCQVVFTVVVTVAFVAIELLPEAARHLVADYGPRSDKKIDKTNGPDGNSATPGQQSNRLVQVLDTVRSYSQVPHAWFASFYAISLAQSAFWLSQYLTDGAVLRYISEWQASSSAPSMTIGQVALTCGLFVLQTGRRASEYLLFAKPSKSKMWILHWFLGFLFYTTLNVAVWVEGSRAILGETQRGTSLGAPPLKTLLGTAGFLFAWVNQYKCHRYLFRLKKYSLPDGGMFQKLVCPHYTCECLLYLSLSLLAAPPGMLWNRTILSCELFTVVGLGVTASGTRKWYIEKFGAERVEQKWTMIPFVF